MKNMHAFDMGSPCNMVSKNAICFRLWYGYWDMVHGVDLVNMLFCFVLL